ncbi:CDP-alcohol phosphatidyltransferase family protein [Nonomuraea antimicrobica]
MSETSAEDRIWTVPNLLSFLRLLGVPVFLWLVLGPKADGWAIGLLAVAGFTDWLDGKIARAFNQTSRLGRIIDPAADKLYVFATLLGLLLRDVIPWWLVAVILARELFVASFAPVLRKHGYRALQVHFLGKAAMFNLMYAFPSSSLPPTPDGMPKLRKLSGGHSRSGERDCTGGRGCCTWCRCANW